MGLFTAITGQDYRDEVYLKTLNHCLRKIRDKADDMGVNLNDYYNISNANSFQEESILFFLANAAIVDQNEKESILKMVVRDQKALNKILNEFLRSNGIRGMDFKSSLRPNRVLVQGAFGRDFILAEKHKTGDPDVVMTKFIQSLVDEIPYGASTPYG